MEVIKCNKCGRDLVEEVKYRQVGMDYWLCKNCYHNSDTLNDRDLGKAKITLNYN